MAPNFNGRSKCLWNRPEQSSIGRSLYLRVEHTNLLQTLIGFCEDSKSASKCDGENFLLMT